MIHDNMVNIKQLFACDSLSLSSSIISSYTTCTYLLDVVCQYNNVQKVEFVSKLLTTALMMKFNDHVVTTAPHFVGQF